jgi:hypothetical protein
MLKRGVILKRMRNAFRTAFGIEGRWKRKMVQLIERLSGQPKIKKII